MLQAACFQLRSHRYADLERFGSPLPISGDFLAYPKFDLNFAQIVFIPNSVPAVFGRRDRFSDCFRFFTRLVLTCKWYQIYPSRYNTQSVLYMWTIMYYCERNYRLKTRFYCMHHYRDIGRLSKLLSNFSVLWKIISGLSYRVLDVDYFFNVDFCGLLHLSFDLYKLCCINERRVGLHGSQRLALESGFS